MQGLQGKTALVTGGATGIGLAICHRLANAKCSVIILDVDRTAAEAAVERLRRPGVSAEMVIADVSNYEQVRSGIASIDRDIHVLVNNAGWDSFMPFAETTPDIWQKIVGINLFGTFNTLHAVLPQMLSRASGRVINIASDAGRVGASGQVPYSASKGGVIALTKAVAREVAAKGITANVVCPGPIDTAMLSTVINSSANPDKLTNAYLRAIPMRRFGKPDDVAGLVAFLASDEALYITGQVVSASGGLTMS